MDTLTHLSTRVLSFVQRRTVFALILLLELLLIGIALVFVLIGPFSGDTDADTAQHPRVIYLAPADAYAPNLYLTDLVTGETRPLTGAEHGIEDYAISPGGNQIAYSQNNADGSADLWLYDLETDITRPITRCVAALCSGPTWKPDGAQIAYQRRDSGSGSRVWIVDLATLDTRLLFEDPAILGSDPSWSPDGARLAVFDPGAGEIRLHEFAAGEITGKYVVIASRQGVTGYFSPDGRQLVYPVLVRGALGEQFYTHLELADLDTGIRRRLSGPEDAAVEDSLAVWSPDGTEMILARRYLDARYTGGMQLYWLDVESGDVAPLVEDAAYTHAAPCWAVDGTPGNAQIIFQRFSLVESSAQPEIWSLDVESGALTEIAANAFLPGCLP
ncbi:MAG: hypothetical protein JXQ72_10985 [Anaerolineae bacterium]|nr:hypothetical protein [Anaerolineae bacterium]